MPPPKLTDRIKSIQNVRLAQSSSTWDIQIGYPDSSKDGSITTITPPSSEDISNPPLALPSLTHPHIHLDKAFIHSSPEYAHLLPSSGSFQEALSFTTNAKQQFTREDLLRRGEWLLAESVSAGVTAMRAFVEVDSAVKFTCLEAGLALKEQWKDSCEIQIACFAQDPIFSGEFGEQNRSLVEEALCNYPGIDVVGTTPYVESSVEAAKRNIEWAIERALQLGKHVDFHLDYNLDPERGALVWHVVKILRESRWTTNSTRKRVMLGHCTRLTLFKDEEWERLAREIRDYDLPVSFVGLPTSDLYMASSPSASSDQCPHHRPRGTLQVPEMIRRYGLDAVLGVNNVGNAFTPWASPDPLFLACLGVGIYQSGTQVDAELLYECVSTRARKAIGLPSASGLTLRPGDVPDLILFYDRDETGCEVSRPRYSVADVIWDPPARLNRDVLRGGRLKPAALPGWSLDTRYQFA
ncbi:uncharacterized protein PFLUO_LOCUS6382 [Penicillium psychrofluorescens]|uniref:uncharacterized protein n=1 Tax=Penicillium psychrofluorescens TaxID=3158075 RepID=UPI003CCE31D9